MNRFQNYTNFVKIEHTLFSLPLVMAGALLAQQGWPSPRILFLMLLAVMGARTVAMTLNRIFDRKYDKDNPRTQTRPLASGTMRLWEAWIIAAASLALYLISVRMISLFCFQLSWIPLLAFAAYPFFKRFTKWAHVGLGLVWSLIPLAGFFSVNPGPEGLAPVVALSIFCVFWLAGFDIIYAIQDEDFDRSAGLHSLPAKWGRDRALRLSGIFHLLAFLVLTTMYAIWFSGPLTLLLLLTTGVLLYMEHQTADYVDVAFFYLNVAIGFMVFILTITGLKGV